MVSLIMINNVLTISSLLFIYLKQPTELPAKPENFTRNQMLTGNTKVISYRGGNLEARENSLSAIQQSNQLKVHGVHFEVRRSADGQYVLLADENLQRVTGQDMEISKTHYADIGPYLDSINDGRGNVFYSPNEEGEKPPLLEEVLDYLVDTDLLIYIEDKMSNKKDTYWMLSMLKKKGMLNRLILQTQLDWNLVKAHFGHSINFVNGREEVADTYQKFFDGSFSSQETEFKSDVFGTFYDFESIRNDPDFESVQELVTFLEEKEPQIRLMNGFLQEKKIPIMYGVANNIPEFTLSNHLCCDAMVSGKPAAAQVWIKSSSSGWRASPLY